MNFLAGRDSIAYLQYALDEHIDETSVVFNAEFYSICLGKKYNDIDYSEYSKNFLGFLTYDQKQVLNNILGSLKEMIDFELSGNDKTNMDKFKNNNKDLVNAISSLFSDGTLAESGIEGKYDCRYLEYSLNLMYSALWDYAWEARILCALSCCIGFFGSVAVHCFLWVMYYWRRDEYNPRNNENNNRPKIRKAPENNYNNYEDNDNNYNSNNEDNYDNNYYQKNNYSPPKTEVIRVKNPPPVDMQQDSYVELANDKKNDSSMGDSD